MNLADVVLAKARVNAETIVIANAFVAINAMKTTTASARSERATHFKVTGFED